MNEPIWCNLWLDWILQCSCAGICRFSNFNTNSRISTNECLRLYKYVKFKSSMSVIRIFPDRFSFTNHKNEPIININHINSYMCVYLYLYWKSYLYWSKYRLFILNKMKKNQIIFTSINALSFLFFIFCSSQQIISTNSLHNSTCLWVSSSQKEK